MKRRSNRVVRHKAMMRAVFLDRDGVINRKAGEGQYIIRWEDFELLPGVPQAIRAFNRARFFVVVVTNQRCVAKGLLSQSGLRRIHEAMVEEVTKEGAVIDAVYCCPHDDSLLCGCRKPKPGMLLQAAKEHGIDLRASWMIGDAIADIAAGKAAGCKTICLASDTAGTAPDVAADFSVPSLRRAVSVVLRSTIRRSVRGQGVA